MFYHSLPKDGAIRRVGRWALRRIRPYRDTRRHSGIEELNLWQEGFCAWNADRLGITVDESRRRYRTSWQVLPGGHGGDAFRGFCDTQMEVFRVIADDSPAETYDAYMFHSWLFLLRQVSLPVPVWSDSDPMFQAVKGLPAPTIIDFGCGLAQTSVSLALALKAQGVRPHVVLADVPTVRLEFITWLCQWVGLSCETRACTRDRPLPELPAAEVVVATEIFEHLHDPIPAFEHLDAALRPGGFLVTNIDDHRDEFMHVSPDLGALRNRITALGYAELDRYVLFRKRMAAVVSSSEVAA